MPHWELLSQVVSLCKDIEHESYGNITCSSMTCPTHTLASESFSNEMTLVLNCLLGLEYTSTGDRIQLEDINSVENLGRSGLVILCTGGTILEL